MSVLFVVFGGKTDVVCHEDTRWILFDDLSLVELRMRLLDHEIGAQIIQDFYSFQSFFQFSFPLVNHLDHFINLIRKIVIKNSVTSFVLLLLID